MPRGPLADDWLFWDPETIFAYPHSCEGRSQSGDPGDMARDDQEPRQLDLFIAPDRQDTPGI